MRSFCELFGAVTVKSFSSENQIKSTEWVSWIFLQQLSGTLMSCHLLASVNSWALRLLRHFICKSFLMMLCTDEREMCASRAISVWQNDGCVGGLLDCAQAHKRTRRFQQYALTVDDHYRQGVQHNHICQFFPASDLNHHETISCSEIF